MPSPSASRVFAARCAAAWVWKSAQVAAAARAVRPAAAGTAMASASANGRTRGIGSSFAAAVATPSPGSGASLRPRAREWRRASPVHAARGACSRCSPRFPALAAADVAARPPIVPQASIRGVALDMTPSEVRSRLGAPSASGVSPNPIIGKVRIWRYPGLRIVFDSVKAGRTVLSVTTHQPQRPHDGRRRRRVAGGRRAAARPGRALRDPLRLPQLHGRAARSPVRSRRTSRSRAPERSRGSRSRRSSTRGCGAFARPGVLSTPTV